MKFFLIRRAVDDLTEKLALLSEPRVSSQREGKQHDVGHEGHADGHGVGQGDGQGVGHLEQQPGVNFTIFLSVAKS